MEIDPRLRSDTSSGSPYPQLQRASGSSAPPPLAPNPPHLSLSHQYQLAQQSASYQAGYPPRTSQSVGDIGTTDRQGTAHGGTAEEGTTNDPKRPRACEACRGLKVRCELDLNNPSGPCKRCAKANRNCVITVPSRKRQKKTDSRVAELEKKIDALTATLHATKSGSLSAGHGSENDGDHDAPNAGGPPNPYEQVTNGGYALAFETRHGTDSWTPPDRLSKRSNSDGRPGPPPMVIAGQKRKYQEGRDYSIITPTPSSLGTSQSNSATRSKISPFIMGEFRGGTSATGPNLSNQYADVIDRGVITMEKATQMFNRYMNDMAKHLPAVVFPAGTTAAEIRKTKPTLFLAILSAGSGSYHPEIQRILTNEVMQVYAEKIICHGEKTLELVQSLLVSTIWYWPPEHFEELKFYQLIHLAAVMGLDINIGKKSKAQKARTGAPGLWRDHPWRRTPFPDAETLEARRAWLGCYFMCCAASMGLRRPNLLQWTPYMADCVEILETSPDAAPTDKFLCQWVGCQRIAEEVGVQFSMDDPFATVNIADSKVQYALKGFERDLEHWSEQVPNEIRAPTLKMQEHVINLYMHEIAMHVDHNVEEFKPPFTEEALRGAGTQEQNDTTPLTPAHISALSTCLQSIDGIFEAFLSLDLEVVRALPVLYFARIAYAVVVLIKMYFAAAKPNKELGKVIDKDNMKVEGYLDGLLDKFRTCAADDKSRPAAKFLMVLVMLKTWFHRAKAGKLGSLKIDGCPMSGQNAEVETPGQTPGPSGAAVTQPTILQHQQQQQTDYSPANTPLQLLSEVATGGTSRPESRNQYSSNEWHQNQQVQQPQPFNYTDPASSNQLQPGYGMTYGVNNTIDPTLSTSQDFDFAVGDGFEQAMGMTLGDGDIGKYFQDDAFFGAMMDSVGGAVSVFEGY